MAMESDVEKMQKFLREHILQSGLDGQSFMAFMGTIKGEGENIKLQNWTLPELQTCVQEFKNKLQQQSNQEQQLKSESDGSKQIITNIIMEFMEKQKIYYDRDNLWDYKINTKQKCTKIEKAFQLTQNSEITYKSWELKKTQGYFFGIGAKTDLEITLDSNFTTDAVTRKSEEADWLRKVLIAKFPGLFVPPLQQSRYLEAEDKQGILKRVKKIVLFLNSILNFEQLAQSKYFKMFMSEKNSKVFNTFKLNHKPVAQEKHDISLVYNVEGEFSVEISERINNFVKVASEFGKQAEEIHVSLQTNLRRMMSDLQNLQKHSHSVANDFAKLHDKFKKMTQKCKISNSNKEMTKILAFMNNIFTSMGYQYKNELGIIKQVVNDFISYSLEQWNEFLILQRKYNRDLNNYLSFKSSLQKKKQRNVCDIKKWELNEKEEFQMSRINIQSMQKEKVFQMMCPKENKIQKEMRIWQAYLNDMYEKSFTILISEQERLYIKNFGKFCAQLKKLALEKSEMHTKFQETFLDPVEIVQITQ